MIRRGHDSLPAKRHYLFEYRLAVGCNDYISSQPGIEGVLIYMLYNEVCLSGVQGAYPENGSMRSGRYNNNSGHIYIQLLNYILITYQIWTLNAN